MNGTVNAALAGQFGAAPFSSAYISIGGINRADGEAFPQYSGDFLIIDRADYPVVISFVDAQTNERLAQVAYPGFEYRAPFRNLTVSHPLIDNSSGVVDIVLAFTYGRGGSKTSSRSEVSMPTMGAAKLAASTGLAASIVAKIPPGAQLLKFACYSFFATTVTSAVLRVQNSAGTALASAPKIGTLNSAVPIGGFFDIASPFGGAFKLTIQNVAIPAMAGNVLIDIVGTGIANPLFGGVGAGACEIWQ